ncbi:hypothetical protein PLESTB_000915300 [Pleodorina starrii]|uniref:Uncharacterized protein n=1 Tax=Pleodorina starrii TaxID=330485 RepID=A0A9W6BP30_9CHLO|nr:hypothetical protein PLESTM_001526300 [Pleodorina starrii]GLC54876.1 hypothetical protein PLESTB_000915300 [Pleodorina starrii]GLC73675.1 hypothetical protein PLESTF_001407200 [Pleodorina starrii]
MLPVTRFRAPSVAGGRSRMSILAPSCRPGLRRRNLVRAEPSEFGLAPAQPKTPYGEMLQYYLRMEPHLFKNAVDTQLAKLRDEKLRRQEKEEQLSASSDRTELALYKRMEEVREGEVRATLEDLMYVSILEKFLLLGVDMLPRMDGFVDPPATNLKALTEGLHSKEALELVREHLLSVMGNAASAYSAAYVKMSKFQMAQVYAASVMFGYFLRRVDQRFQLEKALGTLPLSKEDAVARLERLFAAAEDVETSGNPDWADATTVDLDSPSPSSSFSRGSIDDERDAPSASTSSSGPGSGLGSGSGPRRAASPDGGRGSKSSLRRYVESFDQATMVETARVVSVEGAALVERQTSALLGDIKKLTAQMQEVVGDNASSMQEAIERMAKAVEHDMVETVTMQVTTQRRSVLEAVAFGSFLRDVEGWVQDEYALLTPIPPPQLPPGAAV